MWASSRLGDSACFHIDMSDRERRERDSMEFECRNVPGRYRAFPSFARSYVYSFIYACVWARESSRRVGITERNVHWSVNDSVAKCPINIYLLSSTAFPRY